MRPARWSSGLVAVLASVLLLPVAAAGAPPELVAICHLTSESPPEGRQWLRVDISARALDKHLDHGDGLPGGEVPGSDDGATFDESCLPSGSPAEDPPAEDPPADPPDENPPGEDPPGEDPPAEDPPGEDPPDLVFSLAYADTNPDDGGYDPTVDILIAKLVDGPGEAGDGLPGPGDLILTHQYPKDFEPSSFGQFGVTEHVVSDVEVGTSYLCNVSTSGGRFIWSSGDGLFDLYQEYDASMTTQLIVMDGKAVDSDTISISNASPSQPLEAVPAMSVFDPSDQSFIDVEADCSAWVDPTSD